MKAICIRVDYLPVFIFLFVTSTIILEIQLKCKINVIQFLSLLIIDSTACLFCSMMWLGMRFRMPRLSRMSSFNRTIIRLLRINRIKV